MKMVTEFTLFLRMLPEFEGSWTEEYFEDGLQYIRTAQNKLRTTGSVSGGNQEVHEANRLFVNWFEGILEPGGFTYEAYYSGGWTPETNLQRRLHNSIGQTSVHLKHGGEPVGSGQLELF